MMAMRWDKAVVLGWVCLTAVVVAYELWCVLNGSTHTPPLTDVTVRYMPWWITIPFLTWLLMHFTIHYADASGLFAKIFRG